MSSVNNRSVKKTILEEQFQFFNLFNPTNHRGREELQALLTGEGALNLAPYSILNHLLAPKFRQKRPNCKTVIEETRYRDKDHTKAISSMYSKSFRGVASECNRLHFFSDYISNPNVVNLNKYNNSYIGFCVIRPFSRRRIGRTFLKKPVDAPAFEYHTCQGQQDVHIGGRRLKLKGSAYMEQDGMVAACATTSLWMSTTILAQKFGQRQLSTSEITQKATECIVGNRPMPSHGLNADQMIYCLRDMDYDPLLEQVYDQRGAAFSLYSFIESEIPPILLCDLASGGHHTLVGIGHGFQTPVTDPQRNQADWPDEPPLSFARSNEWVPYFLVNDDQRGIYRKIHILNIPEENLIQELKDVIVKYHPDADLNDLNLHEWKCPILIDNDLPHADISEKTEPEIANILGILVPLPHGVVLTAEQAEAKAARVIRLWHWTNQKTVPTNLVLRTYLSPSNEYKERIANSSIHSFVKYMIQGKPMPRWIWISEISSIDNHNTPNPNNRLLLGEVLNDATSGALTPDFLSFHLVDDEEGILATMMPEHKDTEEALIDFWVIPDDYQYPCWARI